MSPETVFNRREEYVWKSKFKISVTQMRFTRACRQHLLCKVLASHRDKIHLQIIALLRTQRTVHHLYLYWGVNLEQPHLDNNVGAIMFAHILSLQDPAFLRSLSTI
ncbi:hypothetical protein M758_5G053200 [Ceratodon purpureus]|nr:hypothetical protein M758_5G053200 [Ceratodon purpureus]